MISDGSGAQSTPNVRDAPPVHAGDATADVAAATAVAATVAPTPVTTAASTGCTTSAADRQLQARIETFVGGEESWQTRSMEDEDSRVGYVWRVRRGDEGGHQSNVRCCSCGTTKTRCQRMKARHRHEEKLRTRVHLWHMQGREREEDGGKFGGSEGRALQESPKVVGTTAGHPVGSDPPRWAVDGSRRRR